MDDVYFEVTILSKTWTFNGFDEIRDLCEWMDENASGTRANDPSAPPDLPTPAVEARTA